MEELQKQVRRAAYRLGAQRFVTALGWCLTGALTLAAVLILVDRFWPLGVAAAVWVGGAVALGLAAATVWAVARGRGPVEAALEIDRRFGLKERVSSTLALSEEDRQTEAGRALTEDAVRRVKRINVDERIKVSPGRPLLYPLIPAAIALLIALLVSPAVVDNSAEAKTDPERTKEEVRKSVKKLERKLADQRKKAQELGLKEAEKVLQVLAEKAQDLSKNTPADRRKAMAEINDLADKIKQRRDQAGGSKGVQDQLRQLKNPERGPADKFTQAVKEGDFKKAQEALNNLRQKMENGQLDKKDKEQLGKQLDQMQKKLQQMADAHEKAKKQLEDQIQQAKNAGNPEQANKLQEQLAKLQQQAPQMDQMKQMAKQLQNCANCMKNGQMKDAGDAMKQLADQLGDMQKQLDEMQMLDDAMDQLAQCRQGMCQGNKPGGNPGEGNKPGDGMGAGDAGWGRRPEQAEKTGFRDTKTRQQVEKGAMVLAGETDGPNRKGNVGQEIQRQVEAARHEQADPLTDQRIPRDYRDPVGDYFTRLREGDEPTTDTPSTPK